MELYSNHQLQAKISHMSLDHKIGQLFLLAYPGKDPKVIEPLIQKYGISGCYISQDNAETFAEATATSEALQQMNISDIPLLLGVDQEGAWGVLVPQSHTGPGNLALGCLEDTNATKMMYEIFSEEMLSVGYNAILGPCADINTDPNSPIIGTRSFGEFPDRVAHHVEAAVEGCRAMGALSTLKHFPGHGSTSGDSHRLIPEVNKSLDELMKSDLLPFKKGIDAGASMVMTAHIRYPQIDAKNPATLSSVILKDILRKKLGFKGVILSDSMNMGAIRGFYEPAESTILALKAGVDIIMLSEEHYDHNSHYLFQQTASLEAVKKAIKEGKLTEEEINQKLMRILYMKLNKMQIKTTPLIEKQRESFNVQEASITQKTIMLLQKNFWPLSPEENIVCINTTPKNSYQNIINSRGIGANQVKPAFDSFCEQWQALNEKITFLSYEEAQNSSIIHTANALILVTEDYPLPGEDFDVKAQQDFIKSLSEKYKEKIIIVALRSPYELSHYPKDVTYLCAYSSRACSAKAAAHALNDPNMIFKNHPPVTVRV